MFLRIAGWINDSMIVMRKQCPFVKCYFSLFACVSGAFLLFSKKMFPKVKLRRQSAEGDSVNGRSAVVQQVSYTQHQLLLEFYIKYPKLWWTLVRSCSNGTCWKKAADLNTAGRRQPVLSPLSVSLDLMSALDQCLRPFRVSPTDTFRSEASRGRMFWMLTGALHSCFMALQSTWTTVLTNWSLRPSSLLALCN